MITPAPLLVPLFLAEAWAQDPPPANPPPADPPPAEPPPALPTGGGTKVDVDVNLSGLTICGPEDCCPAATAQKVFVGVGTLVMLVLFVVAFSFMLERRFVDTDRSPQFGRSIGASLGLFFTAVGMGALVYLVTGCLHPEFYVWIGFVGVVTLAYFIFTMLVVRGR